MRANIECTEGLCRNHTCPDISQHHAFPALTNITELPEHHAGPCLTVRLSVAMLQCVTVTAP